MKRVLVVDDERAILESMQLLLEALGFEAVMCPDASQVLRLLRSGRPDVVLHDVRMPGLDIASQVRRIRADPDFGDVPIILFTATMGARAMAMSIGADDGIEKPFDPDTLQATLRSWADRRHGSP